MKRTGKKPVSRMNRQEKLSAVLIYALLCGLISILFYRSLPAFLLLLPGYVLFRKLYAERMGVKHQRKIREEFLTGMQFVSTSLCAGYSVENAFREGEKELKGIYGEDADMVRAFRRVNDRLTLNHPLEKALTEMGEQTGAEDIIQFADVFQAARRSGGDLTAIVRNTVMIIQVKEETQTEIETALSGKELEGNMMSVITLFILGYVSLTSPDFLKPLYVFPAGTLIMTVFLAVYVFAVWWTRRIMDIQI